MKNRLIADAGSTKVEWTLLRNDGEIAFTLISDGLNALLATPDIVKDTFRKVSDQVPQDLNIDEIYYYGAGCATSAICSGMKDSIAQLWPDSEINVASDLLGAARSLFGERKGIACILGTGSNSCLYDGVAIIHQIPSLGYLLGDEGSGAALGKRLIADVFKHQLPSFVREKFLATYSLTLSDILDNVYRNQSPNKFLASLVPFIYDNLWNPYIYSLVLKEFKNFIRRNVAMYPGAHSHEISFTGSIAFHFDKILREAAELLGYSVKKISKTPMSGLLEYHKKSHTQVN